MLKVHGKHKFSHYLHDIGLRHTLVASLAAVSLTFSIAVPLLCPLMALVFLAGYASDKYNLIFVYPLDFES